MHTSESHRSSGSSIRVLLPIAYSFMSRPRLLLVHS